MAATQNKTGNSVVLHDMSWEQFEGLLTLLGDRRASRLAYADHRLEIMTPLPEHEYLKQTLSIAIEDIAEALGYDYACYGSSTWRRQDQQAGVEPDDCFYFQNEPQIRGQLQFDLSRDPPPDLAIEIDLTHKALNRFAIYGRLGVGELWCYQGQTLQIYRLRDGIYEPVEQSGIFPTLAIAALPDLIESYRLQGRRALRQGVRAWVAAQQETGLA